MKCCGADGPDDYADLFDISAPEECIDRYHAGGLEYQRGCALHFTIWLRAWAGGISAGLIIAAILEVCILLTFSIQPAES